MCSKFGKGLSPNLRNPKGERKARENSEHSQPMTVQLRSQLRLSWSPLAFYSNSSLTRKYRFSASTFDLVSSLWKSYLCSLDIADCWPVWLILQNRFAMAESSKVRARPAGTSSRSAEAVVPSAQAERIRERNKRNHAMFLLKLTAFIICMAGFTYYFWPWSNTNPPEFQHPHIRNLNSTDFEEYVSLLLLRLPSLLCCYVYEFACLPWVSEYLFAVFDFEQTADSRIQHFYNGECLKLKQEAQSPVEQQLFAPVCQSDTWCPAQYALWHLDFYLSLHALLFGCQVINMCTLPYCSCITLASPAVRCSDPKIDFAPLEISSALGLWLVIRWKVCNALLTGASCRRAFLSA